MSRFMSLVLLLASTATTKAGSLCTLSEPVPLSQRSGGLFLEQVKNSAEGTYTMRLTYKGGNSWIGVGINTRGWEDMAPAEAVIGRVMGDGETTRVMHYKVSTSADDGSGVDPVSSSSLQNAMFEQPDESTSILTFTQNLDEMGVTDSSQWIFAVGLPNNSWGGEHVINGAFKIALTDNCQIDDSIMGNSTSDLILSDELYSYKNLWMAHGILMAIAWGVCAPLAVGVSLLREVLYNQLGSNWLPVHIYLNMLALLLTLAGFLVAVVAMQKGEGSREHFQDQHHKIGLSIMILVVFQALAGYLRPHSPRATRPSTTATTKDFQSSKLEDGSGGEDVVHDHHEASSKLTASTFPKSLSRMVWEIGHRLAGAVLVALSWYNIQGGIDIQERNFETMEWAPIFWGITGSVPAIIVVLKGYSLMAYSREQ